MPEQRSEYQTLREILIDARTKAGLTQRDLAARIQRGQSVIGKIENGMRNINVIEFIEVARALEIEPTKLLKSVIQAAGL